MLATSKPEIAQTPYTCLRVWWRYQTTRPLAACFCLAQGRHCRGKGAQTSRERCADVRRGVCGRPGWGVQTSRDRSADVWGEVLSRPGRGAWTTGRRVRGRLGRDSRTTCLYASSNRNVRLGHNSWTLALLPPLVFNNFRLLCLRLCGYLHRRHPDTPSWLSCLLQQLVVVGSSHDCTDTVSEWLRRWTRNPLGSARRGSNPLGVVMSC